MAKTVFILGAGASKEAGGPLMGEFLRIARDLKEEGKIKDVAEDVERVIDAIDQLQIVHFKSILNLDNIEEVFGAFEMGRLMNGVGTYSVEEVIELISSLKKLILRTLEISIQFPSDGKRVHPPGPYEEFASLIIDVCGRSREECAVITFNYDISLDYALQFYGIPVNYCLEENVIRSAIKILKLHGSLNWGKCAKEDCSLTIPWNMGDFFKKFHFELWKEPKSITLDIGSKLVNHEHCGRPLLCEPMIVPPTWNKTEYHGNLTNVWAEAGRQLGEAENIFIVGYSHPSSDEFFKYLFALGSIGRAKVRRFWVFDPDKSIEERYAAIVGTGIKRQFKFYSEPFSNAISIIRKEIKVS
jgi:hypothetical protein